MHNPYPKPPSGSYRIPLAESLKGLGTLRVAQSVEDGDIKFGIVSTFNGNVVLINRFLADDLVRLMERSESDILKYYAIEIKAGRVAIVDNRQIERNNAASANKVWRSGELFFTT